MDTQNILWYELGKKAGGGGGSIGYTVTFLKDSTKYAVVSCAVGGSVTAPVDPSKSGYSFTGWYDGTTKITFPYTPSGNISLSAGFVSAETSTITGLGNQDPTTVTFNTTSNFFTNVVAGEVTLSGDTFVRFNKVYRKVNATADGQITSITLSDIKLDDTYSVYPVFLKEDGVTEMDYVLMGKYCSTSSSTANSIDGYGANLAIGDGRTLCQARGTGYQQMDWMFFKLWQDLLIAKMQTVNTNSGSGIQTDQLGVCWYQGSGYQQAWIDGISWQGTANKWAFSYAPTKYADSATSSTDGYQLASYSFSGTTGKEIQALGYDSSYPFANYPTTTVSNSSYNTYYCDSIYIGTSTTHPVYSVVGNETAGSGAFHCESTDSWTGIRRTRLCYRPISS